MGVSSFQLLLSVLEYQTAVMRRDFETADKVLPTVPKEQRTRVAHFLEKQGFKKQALSVSSDPEHKFDLAVQLGDLDTAYELARESASEQKWKQLAELATSRAKFDLAQQCLHEANDHGGLLLLATAAGNAAMVEKLGASATDGGKNNVAFLSYFMLGQLEKCLEVLISTNRVPEAAFFARTYLPSQISRVVGLWRTQLSKVNEKAGQSLADPADYPNLFPNYEASLAAEEMLRKERSQHIPAKDFSEILPNHERKPLEELNAVKDDEDIDMMMDEKDHPVQAPTKPVAEIVSDKDGEDIDEILAEKNLPVEIPTTEQNIPEKDLVDEEETPEAGAASGGDAASITDDLEAELEMDLDNLKLDDIDTSDVNLDDEGLLED